jgi:delta-aminolevulinic acid dehydratase/porphobilinogen synthase
LQAVFAALAERHGFASAAAIAGMDLTRRPRRLRTDGVRPLVRETDLDPTDLIAPVFVDATTDERQPIESMPGHESRRYWKRASRR